MRSLGRIISKITLAIVVCCSLLPGTITAFAAGSDELQSYVDNNEVVAYIPQLESEVTGVSSQIGNSANVEVRLESTADTDENFLLTTILFDNSLSIAESNRDKMKSVASGIVAGHISGEIFSVYTFDTKAREMSANSQAYEELENQIKNIEFINQETYLKNVLYDTFMSSDGENYMYHRFIVLSDGTDDNTVGNTYNEITRILDDKHYAVFAVGSKYDKNLDDLEDMFSIARASSSAYFLISESSDVNAIVDEINAARPGYIAYIEIPDTAKDGSDKIIKLDIQTDKEAYSFRISAEMPFEVIKETTISAETEVVESSVDEVEENNGEDLSESEPVKGNRSMGLGIIAAIIAIIIAGFVIAFNRIQRQKIEQRRFEEMSHREENDDEDETILMCPTDEDATCMPRTIMLRAEDGSVLLDMQCAADITIGRKSICLVQIQGDKSVSGVHCTLTCDGQGNPVVRDNNSSNGTFVNDEKITGETILTDGDTVEIGRTRYIVHIE